MYSILLTLDELKEEERPLGLEYKAHVGRHRA